MSRYEELVRFIVDEIVDEKDAVDIHEEQKDRGLTVRISVSPDDMGKVIGKGGHTIDALRSVVRAAGVRNHDRVYVDLDEPEGAWSGGAVTGADDDDWEDVDEGTDTNV